jgi:hypothetical protein
MDYLQVLTPGYLVVLELKDRTYDYHTDTDQRVILCSEENSPSLPAIPVNPDEILDGKPWMPVDGTEPEAP